MDDLRTNYCTDCKDRQDRITALEAENAGLKAALKPFAQTNVIEPNGVIVALERMHFEKARTAYGAPHAG